MMRKGVSSHVSNRFMFLASHSIQSGHASWTFEFFTGIDGVMSSHIVRAGRTITLNPY